MAEERSYKIGLLHYSCPPVVGGVEEMINQQARVLTTLGHRVTLLAGMGDRYTDEFKIILKPFLGSRTRRVLKANKLSKCGQHQATRLLTQEIYEYLLKTTSDFDILIAHNVMHMPFNLPLCLALRRMALTVNKPVMVSWAHDSPYVRPDLPDYLASPPWNALSRYMPQVLYVTVSGARRRVLKKHLGEFNWHVVNNGINPDQFFYLHDDTAALVREIDPFSRDLVIVKPARITPRKNLELAIRIVHGIKSRGHNILFIITGAYDPHESEVTDYYDRLHSLIQELDLSDNVIILAEYTFEDGTKLVPERFFIRDLYYLADLLLMTSVDEGFGLPLLEAGMAKLPIACTDIPPFKEIGRDVCFFKADDPPLFIAGRILEYLARNPTHKMFKQVMRNYVWESICRNELVPLLEEAMGHENEV